MGLPRATHPVHNMVLPSNKQKLQFRPYLVKEEKILLIALESNDEKEMLEATKRVLCNCILDENFDIETMTVFDLQYAFIQLRAKSVGEIIDLKMICKDCEHPNDYKLNFMDVNVDIPKDMDFNIQLEGDIMIKMRFPNTGLLNQFTNKDMMKAENSTELIMACVEEVWKGQTRHDPHEETLEEQEEFFGTLTIKDMKKIEAWTDKIPVISYTIKFKCEQCDQDNVRNIGGMSDFF